VSRHRPLHGADSAEAYVLKPYRVLMCDRFDEDDRQWVTIEAALGRHDAFNQAREKRPELSPLMAEECEIDWSAKRLRAAKDALADYHDAELERAKESAA
jgi:hypothetical protein